MVLWLLRWATVRIGEGKEEDTRLTSKCSPSGPSLVRTQHSVQSRFVGQPRWSWDHQWKKKWIIIQFAIHWGVVTTESETSPIWFWVIIVLYLAPNIMKTMAHRILTIQKIFSPLTTCDKKYVIICLFWTNSPVSNIWDVLLSLANRATPKILCFSLFWRFAEW